MITSHIWCAVLKIVMNTTNEEHLMIVLTIYHEWYMIASTADMIIKIVFKYTRTLYSLLQLDTAKFQLLCH